MKIVMTGSVSGYTPTILVLYKPFI